jgi:MOSC domain-containing protein YiiM
MPGTILQISVSRGGVPKLPLERATVTERGVAGDGHNDRRSHGRPEQALCLWAVEVIEALRAEGHDVWPGCTGENITTSGVDWGNMLPGVRVQLGSEVLVEITDYASPCWKNARWFSDGDIDRINQETHPGSSRVYARVLTGGEIETADPVTVFEESAGDRLQRQQIRTFRWPRDFQ